MVRRHQRQRGLWEALVPDADKLSPPICGAWMRCWGDDAVLDPIMQALEARWPQRAAGRAGRARPPTSCCGCCRSKHPYRWSYDALEYDMRTNLVYRALARGIVPDAKKILTIARILGADVSQQLHARIVQLAVARRVTRGRRLRVDTTVVETDVHYPTDNTLLRDGVRVLT